MRVPAITGPGPDSRSPPPCCIGFGVTGRLAKDFSDAVEGAVGNEGARVAAVGNPGTVGNDEAVGNPVGNDEARDGTVGNPVEGAVGNPVEGSVGVAAILCSIEDRPSIVSGAITERITIDDGESLAISPIVVNNEETGGISGGSAEGHATPPLTP